MELRGVETAEQPEALALWYEVFAPGEGYFERYFAADPWYRAGDCLGAWDGGRLVSAVHVCRRPLEWDGETIWCGAIANVGTVPEYRCQGLSRQLLGMAIERMEGEGFDFSMLFTGRHGHYAALGWEVVPTPNLTLHLSREGINVFGAEIHEMVRKDWVSLADLWLKSARRLRLQRTPAYAAGWCSWEWRTRGGRVFVLPERGYVVLSESKSDGETLSIEEMAADNAVTELRLVRHAAALARAIGRSKLRMPAPHQATLANLAGEGVVKTSISRHMMLRNVGLEGNRYRELTETYETGAANWWPSDDF